MLRHFAIFALLLIQLRGGCGHEQSKPASTTVYITETGTKYHKSGCRALRKSKIPVSVEDVIGRGYSPCRICKPIVP